MTPPAPAAPAAWPAEGARLLEPSIEAGRVDLNPAAEDGDLAADPARAFRDRAAQLLDVWTSPGHQRQLIEIADCPLPASVMAAAAALEVAVHGWDISRACGQRQPIPRALATGLLAIAPVLVPRTGRHPLFAAPVTVAATAGPSDRLAAFLGRTPRPLRHASELNPSRSPRSALGLPPHNCGNTCALPNS